MTASLYAVTFDCADPARLADFWSRVLGRPIDRGASDEFAPIGIFGPRSGDPGWMFVTVPEDKQAKNRCHPDLTAADPPPTHLARLRTPRHRGCCRCRGCPGPGAAPATPAGPKRRRARQVRPAPPSSRRPAAT